MPKPPKPTPAERIIATATVHYTTPKGRKNQWSFGCVLPQDDAAALMKHAERWLPKGSVVNKIRVSRTSNSPSRKESNPWTPK
jgi:hypothetical protein